MAEGGLLAWKRQTIDEHRGPAVSYRSIRGPLPPPPKNMEWVHDETTREWRLAPKDVTVVEVSVIDGDAPSDFLQHTIQPTDTFQGICLRYKVTPTELRRANCFSGSNLLFAPNPLKVPINSNVDVVEAVPVNRPTRASQIQAVVRACPALALSEAKCFLELHDWDVAKAIRDARDEYDGNSTDMNDMKAKSVV